MKANTSVEVLGYIHSYMFLTTVLTCHGRFHSEYKNQVENLNRFCV